MTNKSLAGLKPIHPGNSLYRLTWSGSPHYRIERLSPLQDRAALLRNLPHAPDQLKLLQSATARPPSSIIDREGVKPRPERRGE